MARQRSSPKSPARTNPKPRPAPGSHRYTAPTPQSKRHSPLWVPVAMFTFLGCGLAVIMLNYLGLLPGGEAQNSDLILGLLLLVGGFVLSTQYR